MKLIEFVHAASVLGCLNTLALEIAAKPTIERSGLGGEKIVVIEADVTDDPAHIAHRKVERQRLEEEIGVLRQQGRNVSLLEPKSVFELMFFRVLPAGVSNELARITRPVSEERTTSLSSYYRVVDVAYERGALFVLCANQQTQIGGGPARFECYMFETSSNSSVPNTKWKWLQPLSEHVFDLRTSVGRFTGSLAMTNLSVELVSSAYKTTNTFSWRFNRWHLDQTNVPSVLWEKDIRVPILLPPPRSAQSK